MARTRWKGVAIALVTIGVAIPLTYSALAAPAPVEMKVACAKKSTGKLRYVKRARDCNGRTEQVVRPSDADPLIACARRGGFVYVVDKRSHCKSARHRPSLTLVLPGGEREDFCADKRTGALRSTEHVPYPRPRNRPEFARACRGDERRVFVPVVNRRPVALDDAATIGEDGPGTIAVLGNDRDPEGEPLEIASVDAASIQGGVVVAPGGERLAYDPRARFESLGAGATATERFTYRATDGERNSRPATVAVTVQGANDAPRVVADTGTTSEDAPVVLSPAGNDSDPDAGDSLSVAAVDAAGTTGTVTRNADGSVTYDPAGRFHDLAAGTTRTDRFRYAVSDGRATSEPVEVTVTVNGAGDGPVAVNDTSATNEDAAITIAVLANDTDADQGDSLSVTSVDTTGTAGAVAINPDGTVGYDPRGRLDDLAQGAHRDDHFTYTVSDAGGGTSTGTVTVDVSGVNDAPGAATSAGQATFTEGAAAVAVDPGFEPSDADDAQLAGATVAIGAGGDPADMLVFTDQNGITGAFAAGTLTLSGSASVADYRTALRSVRFSTPGDNPSLATRTIGFRVDDGSAVSAVATRDVAIAGVNDPPELTAPGGQVAYTENDPATVVDAGVTVGDADSPQLAGATVEISQGFQPGADALSFDAQPGITGDYSAGTLTLSGPASAAAFEAALRSVRYRNTSDDPSTAPRTISFRVGDGSAFSSVEEGNVAVTAVNDAPAIDTSDGSASFTEGGAPVAVDPDIVLTDPDDSNLEAAGVSISGGFEAGDVLAFPGTTTLDVQYAAGILSITGSATVAEYQAVLRGVTFSTGGDDPATSRTISFTANDGVAGSDPASRGLTISPVDDPATVVTSAGPVVYIEGDAPLTIDPGIAIDDVDSTTISGATVVIAMGFDPANDVLALPAQASGITGDYAGGVLTLDGDATRAQYRDALAAVTFAAGGDDPGTDPRTVVFIVDDGAGALPGERQVLVTGVNDRPLVTTQPGSASYTEGGSPAPVDAGVDVTEPDDPQLFGATMRITAGHDPLDVLQFTDTATIDGEYDAGTGLLTLTGVAEVAEYEAALRSVTFSTTSSSPGPSRDVLIRVSDFALESDDRPEAHRAIAIDEVNSSPTVDTSAGSAAFTEDSPPLAVDPAIAVADTDSANLAGATVKIAAGYAEGFDSLDFTDTAAITGDWEPSTGTLTLSGTATVASYQAALQAVTFDSTAQAPSASRTIEFQVDDGEALDNLSAVATRGIAITAVNDAPVVTTQAGSTPYTEQAAASIVDSGVALSDVDSPMLSSARVAISDGFLASEDTLSWTAVLGISGSYDPLTGFLTFTGEAPIGTYEQLLQSVAVESASDDPGPTRTIEFSVDDGAVFEHASNVATRAITITEVNDAPAVTTSGGALDYVESPEPDIVSSPVDPAVDVADADSAQLQGATVAIGDGFVAGQDVLAFTDTADITGDFSAGTLTLTGDASVADYESALRSVEYRNTSQNPTAGTREVTFAVTDDDGATSTGATRDVTVTPSNDAPTAVDDSLAGNDRAVGNTSLVHDGPAAGAAPDPAGPQKTVTGNLLDDDSDPETPGTLAVVGETVTSNDGGSVVIEADGDFTFLPAPVTSCAPGADNSDFFDYKVTDGDRTDTGRVTVTVEDCVWYLDDSAAAGGDGRSNAPFDALADVNAAGDPDGSGHRLFLYEGTYAGGLTLEGTQVLHSERNGLSMPGASGLVPARASVSRIDGGLLLAANNAIQGVDLGNHSGAALSGNAVGTATVNTVTPGAIDNTTGGGVDIVGGTLAIQLSSLSSNGGANGIRLQNTFGSFDADGGTIQNATGAVVALTDSEGAFTYDGAITDATGQLVAITGSESGVKDFNGALTGGGVALTGNTGATIRFDGGLALTAGFAATGGGTVAVTDPPAADNTIATTSGTALDVTGTAIHSEGLTFRSISSDNAARGIVLNGTGTAGGLTVTGSGALPCTNANQTGCTGGVMEDATGVDDSSQTPAGTGIVLRDTEDVSLARMHLRNHSNYAIRGTSVRGFSLVNSVVGGTNGTNEAAPYRDGSISFDGLTVSASITDTAISGGFENNFRLLNSSGTLDRLTFTRANVGTNGGDGIVIESASGGSATVNVTVDDSDFTAAPGDLFNMIANGSGNADLDFTNNTLTNNHPAIAAGGGGITLHGGSGGAMTVDISGNTMRDAVGPAVLIVKDPGTGSLTGTFDNNSIGVAGIANSGSLQGHGLALEQQGKGTLGLAIENNQIRQFNNAGIYLQSGAGIADSGNMNVSLSGNTVANPGNNPAISIPWQGLNVNSGVTPGDTFQTCLDIGAGNTITGSGHHGGQDFRMRRRMNTNIKLPGYGGSADGSGVVAFVQGRMVGGGSGAALTDATPGGYIGGASCP